MTRMMTRTLVLVILASFASATFGFAAQHMNKEGANTVIGTINLIDADSGIIWLKDKDDTRIKMVAPPEEQLKGLEVGNRVEVRLAEPNGAGAASQTDQTVAGAIRKVDKEAKLLRIETDKGNIIDISPVKALSAGMEEGEQVHLTIHKQ